MLRGRSCKLWWSQEIRRFADEEGPSWLWLVGRRLLPRALFRAFFFVFRLEYFLVQFFLGVFVSIY